jgi:hypothetical protein
MKIRIYLSVHQKEEANLRKRLLLPLIINTIKNIKPSFQ